MISRSLCACLIAAGLLVTAGCLPASKPPTVDGVLSTELASKQLGNVRRSYGNKFSVTHEYNGTEFEANWELGNTLKKTSQLQMKLPVDWTEADVFLALETVLNAHESKPWYGKIDETVLVLMRAALKENDNRASGIAPDTPYDTAVKVKHHTGEWFLEVKVQILDEQGMALGI